MKKAKRKHTHGPKLDLPEAKDMPKDQTPKLMSLRDFSAYSGIKLKQLKRMAWMREESAYGPAFLKVGRPLYVDVEKFFELMYERRDTATSVLG